MDSRPLLIFDLDGMRFGLDATRALESVWLPELTPVEEAPTWVVGLFSLRGRIVVVTDLSLRFGHPARRYTTGDQVLVLETDQHPMGLIVSEISEVIDLPANALQPPAEFYAAAPAHLVIGEARVGDGLVAVLDVSRLTHPAGLATFPEGDRPMPAGQFCPDATPEERALFRARALALQEVAVEVEGERLGLAVLELGGEFFGVELAAVKEFCNIVQFSPIPCCPPHILGAINLRGDLITLIDPRATLNLPPAAGSAGKAVIARASTGPDTGFSTQAVGISVDAVHEVVYLREGELQAPPAALRERFGTEITGTAPYAGRILAVLNLPALLAREEWIVNENV